MEQQIPFAAIHMACIRISRLLLILISHFAAKNVDVVLAFGGLGQICFAFRGIPIPDLLELNSSNKEAQLPCLVESSVGCQISG